MTRVCAFCREDVVDESPYASPLRADRHRLNGYLALNGYLVLQGHIPSRTSQLEHVLELPARKRLGTRWAKYPFIGFSNGTLQRRYSRTKYSRCRLAAPGGGDGSGAGENYTWVHTQTIQTSHKSILRSSIRSGALPTFSEGQRARVLAARAVGFFEATLGCGKIGRH